MCPAPLLQLKKKTRNSKSFIQSQTNCECRHLLPLLAKTQNIQHDPVLLPHPQSSWTWHTHCLQALDRFSTQPEFSSLLLHQSWRNIISPLLMRRVTWKASIGKGRATSIKLLTPQNRKYTNIRETKVEYNNPLSKCQRSKWGSVGFVSVCVGNLATWNTQKAQREWECYKCCKLAHSLKICSQ